MLIHAGHFPVSLESILWNTFCELLGYSCFLITYYIGLVPVSPTNVVLVSKNKKIPDTNNAMWCTLFVASFRLFLKLCYTCRPEVDHNRISFIEKTNHFADDIA